MSEITEALLDYANVISTYNATKINSSIVIKGEVLEQSDLASYKYKISYGGAIYTNVYSISNANYAVSSIVNILVPNGDFSDNLFILGGIAPTASDYVTESKSDSYISLGDNLFGDILDTDGNIIETIQLKSWNDETRKLSFSKGQFFNSLFQDYLIDYNTFKFSASIKTDIDINYRYKGDYGLILSLPFINDSTGEKEIKTYFMTTDNMEGDPYNFSSYSRQSFYFTIEDGFIYDNSANASLVVFTKDFNYLEEVTDKNFDIFIKDISLEFVDILDSEDANGYHLTLVSSDGNYFLDGVYAETKTLTPILKVKGKTTSIEDWDCYWFVQNARVTPTHASYLKIAGIGWECKNHRIRTMDNNGKEIFEYVTTDKVAQVAPKDVDSSLRYKCILTKTIQDEGENGTIEHVETVVATILLKNLSSRTTVSLRSATGSNNVTENIGEVQLIAQIKTDIKISTNSGSIDDGNVAGGYLIEWQRFDKNGSYIENKKTVIVDGSEQIIDEQFYTVSKPIYLVEQKEEEIDTLSHKKRMFYTYEVEITFPSSIIEGSNTIYATFYRRSLGATQDVNLGTDSITISTTKEANYILNILNGDVIYKYDSDGDSPLDNAYYDGKSGVKEILPITFQFFKPDGHELTDLEYKTVKYTWWFPYQSLMELDSVDKKDTSIVTLNDEKYYTKSGTGRGEIHYSLASSYDKTRAENNMIKFEVTFNKVTFSTVVNPKLLKDGQGGTNGSKYVATICCKDYDNTNYYGYDEAGTDGIKRKVHLVYAADKKKWYYYKYIGDNKSRLYEVTNTNPEFIVKVYKNSTLLDNNLVKKKWMLFDGENNQTYKCLILNSDTISNDSPAFETTTHHWDNPDKSPFIILECDVTITNEESTLGISNTEIIRTYYPIEVTWVPTFPALDSKGEQPDIYIPTIEGGFDEVLYNIDGNNPEYDNQYFQTFEKEYLDDNKEIQIETVEFNHNFRCVDNIGRTSSNEAGQKQVYNYIWQVGEDQDGKYISTKNANNCNLKITRIYNETGPYAEIKPSTKYHAGQSINYIRLEYKWNDSSFNNIKEEIARLKKLSNDVSQIREYYENNKNNLNILIDNFIADTIDGKRIIKSSWNNLITSKKIKKAINYISLSINSIKNLYNILKNQYYEYCKKYIKNTTNYNYDDRYEDGLSILNSLYVQLYSFGLSGSDEKSINDELDNIPSAYDKNSELYTLFDLKEKDTLTRIKKQEIETLSTAWKNEISILNKYLKQIKSKTIITGLGEGYTYLSHYKELAIFKEKINEIINSTQFRTLITSDKTNYGPKENPIITGIEIDDLINKVNEIKNRLYPIDATGYFDYNIMNNEYKKLESHQEFIENFLNPLFEVFIAVDPLNEEINNNYKQIDETFVKIIEDYNNTIDKYNNILSTPSASHNFVHIKPILVITNTTGFGYLKDWDGSKLYIDENEQYIMSPIMGAGAKEDGKFTGVVMGIRDLNHTREENKTLKTQRIGLHGFSADEPSFFLNARDGSAIFGKSGFGQITIDPSKNKALLYSSNYVVDYDGDDKQGKPEKYDKFGIATFEDKNIKYSRKGMLIDLSTPFIHIADTSGYIYSGKHSTIGNTENGFYLSQDGLSIGDGFVVYAQKTEKGEEAGTSHLEQLGSTLAGWKISEYGGNKGLISAYINEENPGIGIFMDSQTSTIILGSEEGKIYSGKHIDLTSSEKGFYLSNSGFSVASTYYREDYDSTEANPKYIVNSKGKARVFNSKIMLNTSGEPIITTGDHSDIGSNQRGFYLGPDGFSITGEIPIITEYKYDEKIGSTVPVYEYNNLGNVKTKKSKFQINVKDNPIMYSSNHNSLTSKEPGFYIGENGISVWNIFRVEQVKIDKQPIEGLGHLLVGNLQDTKNKKYWTIGGVVEEKEKEWIHILAKGIFYKSNRKTGYELLKTHDTPFIPLLGDGATYITVTKDTKAGTLYMSEEYYPMVLNAFFQWERTQNPQDWPYPEISPYEFKEAMRANTIPNCRVSDGEDGTSREKEKYRWIPAGDPTDWHSYIAYNTDRLYTTAIPDIDAFGQEYTVLKFDKEAKDGQVYIGTDGLRLGKTFAVIDGNAFFSGTIQATHGVIGKNADKGWTISEKGLIGKAGSSTIIDPITKLKYYRRLVIESDGDIGFKYYNSDREEISKELRNLLFERTGKYDWRFYNDGSLNVTGGGSNFGGVAIKTIKIGDNEYKTGTIYDSGENPSTGADSGIFRGNAFSEIEKIAQMVVNRSITPTKE